MKKVLPLVCAASLIANAAFLAIKLRHRSAADDTTPTAGFTAGAANAGAVQGKLIQASPSDLAEVLKAKNPDGLRDFLRSAGLPETTIRKLVAALIWDRYSERMKALSPKPDANKAWWKAGNNSWYESTSREQRAELRNLQREASDEITRVLGPDQESPGHWQDARLTFLDADKRKNVQEIEQDYQDLIHEAQQDMQGFRLPGDSEKIKFLLEEKKRDLAATLTPQELADYDLRMSLTAQQLRSKISRFDGTEEEYRKIFALQKAFDDTQNRDAWGNPFSQTHDEWKKRQEDEKQLKEQIKASLGAERYADYTLAQNNDYQQLVAASKRLGLPPETARQVFDLRSTVSSESVRIVDNPNLGVDQKKQMLAALAQSTRNQISARLGDAAADAYIKKTASWLTSVESGSAVTFGEDGNSTNVRGIATSPKKPAAAK